jgi:hypothetical protein
MAKKAKSDRPGRTEYNVTATQFVTAWQTSSSVQEVSDRLGMPKPIVLARASSYRAAGIKLKKIKKANSRSLDVAALNKLIEKLAREEKPKGEEDE